MNKVFASVLGTAGVAALLILLFYTAPHGASAGAKTQLLFMAVTVILGVGTVGLFLGSLKSFKPGLRVPYTLLSLGILLIPLPEIILLSILIFNIDIRKALWILAITIPAIAFGTILMYLGIRKFAHLLSVHNVWTKLKFVVPSVAGLSIILSGILASILPEVTLQTAPSFVIAFDSLLYAAVATIVAVRVKAMLGPSYLQAMKYLIAAFGMTSFAYTHDVILSLFIAKSVPAYLAYALWPYLVTSFLFLCAGFHFWKASQGRPNVDANATYIDTITYVAGLASNPQALDKPLDKLRIITASMNKEDGQLSASEQATLVDLYLEIEAYLTKQDPLRTFRSDELRSHLTYDFQQALKAHG